MISLCLPAVARAWQGVVALSPQMARRPAADPVPIFSMIAYSSPAVANQMTPLWPPASKSLVSLSYPQPLLCRCILCSLSILKLSYFRAFYHHEQSVFLASWVQCSLKNDNQNTTKASSKDPMSIAPKLHIGELECGYQALPF